MEPFSVERITTLLNGVALPAGTAEALQLAYLLSTQVEEGRPLRFAFLLPSDGMTISPVPKRLLQPIATGSEAIRRLCLATDPNENCWRIRFDQRTKSISVIGVSMLPIFPTRSFLPASCEGTLIEVDGTASLSIRVGSARAKYSRCRHFVPNGDTVLRELIPPAVIESMAESCFKTTEMGSKRYIGIWGGVQPLDQVSYLANRGKLEETAREAAMDLAPAMILIILRRMREFKHGGCIILTEQEFAPQDLFTKFHRLAPLPETELTEYGYNWMFLASVRVVTHLALAQRDGVVVLEELKGKPLEESINLLREVHLSSIDREASRFARLCAQFTVVDGIAVFDPLLEPVMFGGIASVPPTFAEVADKGARHRAAAYCATRLTGSVAIVVSQDGSVTAYRKPSDTMDETELLF